MRTWFSLALCTLFVSASVAACSSSDDNSGSAGKGGSSGSGGSTATGGASSGGSGGSSGTLCAKYGGVTGVEGAIGMVVQEIAGDCRINAFFAGTDVPHIQGCLAIQAEELFSCPGVTYAGSSFNGKPCRSMKVTHAGLGISKGDFDALIDDVVKGLTTAGVEQADINAAAPALTGMQSDIVEDTATTNGKASCDGGTDGG